jgi:membrane associated rhomboid family serine protease
MTYSIIAANFVVFLFMLSLSNQEPAAQRQQRGEIIEQTNGECYGFRTLPTDADRFICRYGFQPLEFFDTLRGKSRATDPNVALVILSIVTAAFLHGGWLHILGNMLFLWVFGDNIEDRLGRLRYLLFYISAAVVAALIQGLVDPNSVVPTVGASGAVAAVLGAYLIWFPKAKVRAVIPMVFLVFIPFRIPAIVMIGIWFLQNLLAGYATITSAATADVGVAWFAHIGGFLFGVVIALALRRPPRRARRAFQG